MLRKTSQEKIGLWTSRIMECRKSGLSDTRWCKENGIAPSSLYYWINKLRMEATEIPVGHYDNSIPVKQDVVPLRVMNDTHLTELHKMTPSTAIIIKLQGISLEIQTGADEATIKHTINALRHLC